MTAYTDTITIDGREVQCISTRSHARMLRWQRLYAALCCEQVDDGMTAQDWQQSRDAAAERAQRQDDAATYGTNRPDAWSVGY